MCYGKMIQRAPSRAALLAAGIAKTVLFATSIVVLSKANSSCSITTGRLCALCISPCSSAGPKLVPSRVQN